ncbi:MAG: hypothetical protein IJ325_03985 [Clostridia bacterium]|nr:hypothetical protein [Clostridia bacterium]
MRKLYLMYKHHMDLTWRRPRYKYGHYHGYAIAPYTDVQEMEIESGLDFIRKGGCYELEQTISLREYLERNPDQYEEIRDMITEGKLHILGGGESVIDTNLPTGEVIIRNYLYSLRWLKEEFGVRPEFADFPDTFGVSGGLPTLLTRLGFKGVSKYDRAFRDAKPFWRGISGDIIPLATSSGNIEMKNAYGWFIDYWFSFGYKKVCDLCKGNGCPACRYNGYIIDPEITTEDHARALVRLVEEKCTDPDEDGLLILGTEEGIVGDNTFDLIKKTAADAGFEICPIGWEDFLKMDRAAVIEQYQKGEISEEEIDPRQEGNPVFSGCYFSRVKLKQMLRKCESALTTCERFSVAAEKEFGIPYPRKTIERLWRQLEFLYFHDAAPASHSDDAYDEIMDIAGQLCVKANRITNKAIAEISRKNTAGTEDGTAFVVFNPLEFPVKNVRLQGVVSVKASEAGGKILHPDGRLTDVIGFRHTKDTTYEQTVVEFYGDLPAFGYQVFKYIPEKKSEVLCENDPDEIIMENKHLRVVIRNCCVDSVLDKHTGKMLADKDTFVPVLNGDAGNIWARVNPSLDSHCEYAHTAMDIERNMVPPDVFERSMSYHKMDTVQWAEVKIQYSRLDLHVNMLDWTVKYELPEDSEELLVDITVKFDAENFRLSTQVVLPQNPKDDKLEYEIPLGKIKRAYTAGPSGEQGHADEWPALHYVCAELDGVNVLICNNGTPAHQLEDILMRRGTMNAPVVDWKKRVMIPLLRTPTILSSAFDIAGAIDKSEHHFRFTLSAAPDRDLTPYRRGAAINTVYPCVQNTYTEKTGSFMPFTLPQNAPLIALKGAEDGKGYIARYLGVEDTTTLHFDKPVCPVDVLEEVTEESVSESELTPFGIQSFRLS